ncbi:outer membrane protein assembly factor BamD [Rhizobium sp. CG4]|jgi:outer membrane protein assembly factor BamD|uniref:outer membrane protein assembly factor BamD n=1 Tax=Rhizobium/Agrobacterium group TaxID=227290 RepID=UPI001780B926|nr:MULTISPECIES: outer membrane protein assembly factor BamD [Rhizobium/Agrobacterium group]MBD9387552.1 outer membrane protein assembly factor BamD [Agrobacterium sp. AGB01]MCM2454075.1 outer membrane protein assembly factor BamD [Rhizobium sp. CG4]MDO5896263.1 outer membrane protein assembly factor BamD [Agrobacterium sp. Azo12]
MKHVGSGAMNRTVRVALVSMLLAGAATLVTACQSDPDIDITKLGFESESAETLYKQGLANMNSGNMTEASRKFEAIDKQHPFTEWGRKALVMQTFVSTRMNRNEQAIAAGNRYLKQYPRSEDSAYVQYLVGLAYSKQIVDVTQDQRAAARTIEAMSKVVNDYPNSEYVSDAQAKIRFARDQLAGKEMQVGRYYLERKEYLAAIKRFRVVVETYPNTNQIEEALARLTESYYAMGLTDEAQTAAAVLGNNYPDSQWYADSFKLLQSGGLQPRENKGSWISKAGLKLLGV